MVGAWPAHVPAIASLVPRSFSLKKELGRQTAATKEFYSKLPYIYILYIVCLYYISINTYYMYAYIYLHTDFDMISFLYMGVIQNSGTKYPKRPYGNTAQNNGRLYISLAFCTRKVSRLEPNNLIVNKMLSLAFQGGLSVRLVSLYSFFGSVAFDVNPITKNMPGKIS